MLMNVQVFAIEDCSVLTLNSGYPIITNPTCGNDNGSIEVVANGTGTVEYSLNGSDFTTNTLFSNLANGNYVITYRDEVCDGKTLTVSLNSSTPINLEEPSVTAANCNTNDDGVIIVQAEGAGLTYQLDNGAITTNNQFTNLSSGNYTVTVYDQYNCNQSQNVNVPQGNLVLENTTVTHTECSEQDGSILLEASTLDNSPINYTLKLDDQVVDSNSTGIFENLSFGRYDIIIESNGCQIEKTKIVEGRIESEIINITDTDCNEENGSFEIDIDNPEDYEFSLNGGPWVSSTSFSDLAAGNYVVKVRDATTGCTGNNLTATILEIESITNVNKTTTNANCNENNGEVQITGTGDGELTYVLYDEDENSIDSNDSGLFSNLSVGDYFFQIFDTSSCETELLPFSIGVNNDINSDISVETENTECGQSSGAVTITATATSGVESYTLDSDLTNTTGYFTDVSSGLHTVTVLSNEGCTRDFDVFVQENNTINITTVQPTQPTTECSEDGEIFVKAEGDGLSFSLTGEPDSFQEGNDNGEFTFTYLNGGSYEIFIQDNKGCQKTTFIELSAGFKINGVNSIPSTCEDANGTLEIQAVGNGLTYKINDGEFQQSQKFENLLAGEYLITVKDENNCELTTNFSLENFGKVRINDLIVEPTFCGDPNGIVTVFSTSENEIEGYSLDGENYVEDSIFTGLSAGSHTFYVRDVNGCTASSTVSVPMSSKPIVDFNVESSVCAEDNGSIRINVEGGEGEILYSLNGGVYSSQNYFDNLSPGEYEFSVIDEVGCEVINTVTIERECMATFPTSFTPNNDGINDVYRILYYKPLEVELFVVYDNWGKKVYEQKNFTSSETEKWWNAYKNTPENYLVYCEYKLDNESKVYSGYVQLIR